MGAMLAIGIVIASIGLAMMSGFANSLMHWIGILFIVGGAIAAIAGGSSILFGNAMSKALGIGWMLLGITLAIVGVFMTFITQFWLVRRIFEFGGVALLIVGIVIAALGLIGLLRGDGKQRINYS